MMEQLSPLDQFAALCTIDAISDLFTASTKEMFTRDEVLSVLNNFRSDPDFFDPDVVVAQQIATQEI